MGKVITVATPPNLIGKPNVKFDNTSFEAVIWNKGYDVIWERACECPCKTHNSSPRTDCQNCLGSGWFFINPIQTKAIITSVNSNTKYQAWSEERVGTVSITFRENEGLSVGKLGFMDRVTLRNTTLLRNTSVFSEIVKVRDLSNNPFLFLTYRPLNILSIFIFDEPTKKLIRLTSDDYSIDETNLYIVNIDFNFISNFNGYLSISYEHELQYHIIDMPHDVRNSFKTNANGKEQQLLLPVNAIARKSNMVYEKQNRDSSNLLDNSWMGILGKILLASEGQLTISNGNIKISEVTI